MLFAIGLIRPDNRDVASSENKVMNMTRHRFRAKCTKLWFSKLCRILGGNFHFFYSVGRNAFLYTSIPKSSIGNKGVGVVLLRLSITLSHDRPARKLSEELQIWNSARVCEHSLRKNHFSLLNDMGKLFNSRCGSQFFEGFPPINPKEGGRGGDIVPPLARLRYSWQKLLIERTPIVIVNSSISVAVILTPFWGPSDIRLNFGGPRLE